MKYSLIFIQFMVWMMLQIPPVTGQDAQSMSRFSIQVSGICGMCKDRIESAANHTKGVKKASWDSATQQLEVEVNPEKFESGLLHFNIATAGHDTELIRAAEEVYEALPACCHYRDDDNVHKTARENPPRIRVFSYHVAGACGMCEDRIEGVALKIPGVYEASWTPESQYLEVKVDTEQFDDIDMLERIAAAGHDTDLIPANEDAYNNLPFCCQYKNADNPHMLESQQEEGNAGSIIGRVLELNAAGELHPLTGANIYWLNANNGTSTDADGNFELEIQPGNQNMVVSYVGYKTDTLTVDLDEGHALDIVLSEAFSLETIEIVHRKMTTEISLVDPIKVHKITEKELQKAACCNLSESFETTPTVDVGFTDAVTGTRKIEMLGLAGKYVQITRESMPDIRGLSSIQGLSYVPGPWIESIQLNMGTGSVVNGYESITGQINVELKKPEDSERFFLNLYGNRAGRMEANVSGKYAFNEHLSTGVLAHGSSLRLRSDHNEDGFLDEAVGDQFIFLNRWKYMGDHGWRMQFGVKTLFQDKTAGQSAFNVDEPEAGFWGATQQTKRTEAWFKTGRIFPDNPYASLGFQLAVVDHDQESRFGLRSYDARQQSLYANTIYQGIFSSTAHQYRTGLSFSMDWVDEQLSDSQFERKEMVPGGFFEYTFKPDEKFTFVSGLRLDWHNEYGLFYTPRINLKYAISDQTVFRVAAGRGLRTASIFAENIGFFASSRTFTIRPEKEGYPYGLGPEIGWNVGLNLTQGFRILNRESVFTIDLYHTRFEDQVVVDLETPGAISFYQLEGPSYSTSVQTQLDFSPVKNLDLRFAWRYNDVKTQYDQGLLQKPLSARHRAFLNVAYAIESGWKFDLTLNWQGKKRIPDTASNPEAYQMEASSPGFFLLNGQISRSWKNTFEMYLGGENLLNFRQSNPIIASDDPFGPYFDSSLVWGPVFGRNIYLGIRYRMD